MVPGRARPAGAGKHGLPAGADERVATTCGLGSSFAVDLSGGGLGVGLEPGAVELEVGRGVEQFDLRVGGAGAVVHVDVPVRRFEDPPKPVEGHASLGDAFDDDSGGLLGVIAEVIAGSQDRHVAVQQCGGDLLRDDAVGAELRVAVEAVLVQTGGVAVDDETGDGDAPAGVHRFAVLSPDIQSARKPRELSRFL